MEMSDKDMKQPVVHVSITKIVLIVLGFFATLFGALVSGIAGWSLLVNLSYHSTMPVVLERIKAMENQQMQYEGIMQERISMSYTEKDAKRDLQIRDIRIENNSKRIIGLEKRYPGYRSQTGTHTKGS